MEGAPQEKMKLFIGQISKQSTEEELRPTFEPFGTIIELVILRDKMNVSKGIVGCRYLFKILRLRISDVRYTRVCSGVH